MSDQHEDHGRRCSCWISVTLLIAIVIAYPLSMGPAWWVVMKRRDNRLQDNFDGYYRPVVLVYDLTGKPDWFREYVEWWEP